ncbi:MAC/perforin domain-containing protein [Pyxidicoccus caerfyrddinensis]|uniref:MAC/perforin domain-containing protein n=1 Tax=Pyxidicoccus caerfyrddinensis TaxID=2709663 RepID=UPI0013DA8458|nr:MAC/perforin domain-containing protein [Pyxidicoccus caerfyrddinensis]
MRQGQAVIPAPECASANRTLAVNVIPGAAILGFGINVVTATSAWDVTQRVVAIDEQQGTTVIENDIQYLLPANISLIDDHSSKIDFSVFASQAEYAEHMATEAQVSVSAWGFSGEFDASYSSLSEGSQASLCGLVDADTSMWEVAIQQLQALSLDPTFQAELAALPATFAPGTAQAFFDFFDKYGTHVVTNATVGGKLHYAVAVSSASSFDKTTAAANMKLEYDSVFTDSSVSGHAEWDRMDTSWISSRNASLSVQGGDASILANAVPPSDPTAYVNYSELISNWATGVKQTPDVTNVKLQPLSHVAPVSQVAVLNQALDAYLNDGIEATSRAELRSEEVVGAACSITLNRQPVPVPASRDVAERPCYWLVLADEEGTIQFNEASSKDDPDELDRLISAARAMSAGQSWWVVAVQCVATNIPSVQALEWLSSCGVPDQPWVNGTYPGWPAQMVAIGKTGSPGFSGRVASVRAPGPDPTDEVQKVNCGLPSHVSLVLAE